MWHLGGLVVARRLNRVGVIPAPEALARMFGELKARLHVSRAVRFAQSILVEVPVAIGWLRPAILVPASALCGLSPREIEAILAHELAHVRRYDYLMNLLQTAAETLLFYHPAAWWLSRRIRIEREHCCDDVAVAACGSRVDFASALATIEKNRTAPDWALAATGTHRPGATLARVRRILGIAAPRRSWAGDWLGGAVTLARVGAIAAAISFPAAAGPARPAAPTPARREGGGDDRPGRGPSQDRGLGRAG